MAYSYDLNCWGIMEGMCSARSHPNLLFWNIIRFNPFYCMLEVRRALQLKTLCSSAEAAAMLVLHMPAAGCSLAELSTIKCLEHSPQAGVAASASDLQMALACCSSCTGR